jgi:alpha-1,2-rhamnosyltransferase
MSLNVRRILLECTNTRATDLSTGIQRVVRNVIREAASLEGELQIECVPVVIKDGEFFRARKSSRRTLLEQAHRLLLHLHQQCSHTCQRGRLATRLRKLLYPKSIVRRLLDATAAMSGERIHFGESDILLMLDASWHLPAWPAIRRAQQQGCPVGCVYYDLIPLQYPEFCVDGPLVPLYRDWLDHAVDELDFFIAISQTVSRGLEQYAHASGRSTEVRSERFESFHLGADFSQSAPDGPTRPELRQLFPEDRAHSPYLCVGTIEPRKNHRHLLDAFELVWQHAPHVKLCIVGGVGWKCEEVVERVRQHPLHGKSLFMFNDVSDTELRFCYERAKTLIFPSIVEGFGLPIVEALHFGLPALASDTPIHREVGEEYCAYFDLNDPRSLAAMILHSEREGAPLAVKSAKDYPFATWTDSCRELLDKCLRLSDAVKRAAAGGPMGPPLPPGVEEKRLEPVPGRDAA